MSDVTLSRSDLFLVLFAAIVLAHMVSAIVRATVTSYLLHRSQSRINDAVANGREMMENLAAARDTIAQAERTEARGGINIYDRDTMNDVRAIQEGAFLSGWRSCEQCRSLRAESEEHALHHFRWRDVAGITEQCTRAGAGACNHLHPSGNICSRPPGHDGKHSHGVLYWTDAESEIGSMLTPGGQ